MFENAFSFLHGFRFANQRSREHALWLFLWMQQAKTTETFRPPLVVVTGPRASGKTTLVSRAAELAGVPVTLDYLRRRGKGPRSSTLDYVASKGCPLLVLDQYNNRTKVDSSDFAAFITHERRLFAGRVMGKTDAPVHCVTVITSETVELSTDLACRSISIELLPRDAPPSDPVSIVEEWFHRRQLDEELKAPFEGLSQDCRTVAQKATRKGDRAKARRFHSFAGIWKRAADRVAELMRAP